MKSFRSYNKYMNKTNSNGANGNWLVINRKGAVCFKGAKSEAYTTAQNLADAEQCLHFIVACDGSSSERVNVLNRR